jgi:hypothetical protein
MRVFAVVRNPPPKTQPRTGVPGVVLRPRADDELVPVPGFDALIAVARRGALVGWAWVREVFGVETVQAARHAGVNFGHWGEYAPKARAGAGR